MKLDRIVKFIPFVVLASFPFSIKAQIIDSVIHRPFANVDSLEYWHKVEQKENNQEYWTFGFYQNCNCDYHKFLNQKNYKSRDKFTTAEGLIVDGKKQGKWIYWINVKGMCCDELQIYPDSTVTYSSGKKIEKFDKYGDYYYKENDSLLVLTRIRKTVIGLKIKCKGNDCRIYTTNNLLLKSFSKEFLNEEIKKADRGEYNFDARNTIERNNKR